MRQPEKRLTIEIDEDLKQNFKAEVSRQGSTLRETLEILIQGFIDQSKKAH